MSSTSIGGWNPVPVPLPVRLASLGAERYSIRLLTGVRRSTRIEATRLKLNTSLIRRQTRRYTSAKSTPRPEGLNAD